MNAYTKVAVLSTIIVAPTPSVTSAAEVPRQPPSPPTNSITIPELSAPKSTIWQDGIGNGFSSSAQSVTLEAGVALGMSKLGSHQAHDLAQTSELKYYHFSCAGISNPNSGMNNIGGMIGLTWFCGK